MVRIKIRIHSKLIPIKKNYLMRSKKLFQERIKEFVQGWAGSNFLLSGGGEAPGSAAVRSWKPCKPLNTKDFTGLGVWVLSPKNTPPPPSPTWIHLWVVEQQTTSSTTSFVRWVNLKRVFQLNLLKFCLFLKNILFKKYFISANLCNWYFWTEEFENFAAA